MSEMQTVIALRSVLQFPVTERQDENSPVFKTIYFKTKKKKNGFCIISVYGIAVDDDKYPSP